MRRLLGFMVVMICLLSWRDSASQPKPKPKWPPSPHVAATEALTPAEQQKKFKLPPGFEIELVAAEPDIKLPININFDARGRLWVSMSSEYPFPAKDPTKTVDTVKVLEDFGPDGRARKVTTFADNLNIPIGVLPRRDGAIVYSIPNIWYMRDPEGTGKATQREVLYGTYGYKDTHGMTGEFMMGFDGWIYCCHGFANETNLKAKDGTTIKMTSGNTYRIKPDGTQLQQYTWGQVNPFGLAFDPLGNLYTTDCHTLPIYQLLKGAYYPSFGKPHDGLGFGPEMIKHSHGSTALCGITYYAADQFPKDFQDNIFIGNVVTNRINRDKLKYNGSSPVAIEQPDFVSCTDPWFRPVDIKLGPDGALYVADFYNRVIGHYEVPLTHPARTNSYGRIWRIVYRGEGAKAPAMPRSDWTRATVAELIEDLGHPNLTVRLTATHELAERGGKEGADAVQALLKGKNSAWQRMHAGWVLHRLNALDEETLQKLLEDPEPGVRVHALRVLAERSTLSPALIHTLAHLLEEDKDALVKRTAAQVYGAHPGTANVRPLLALLAATPTADTHLRHVTRMALRDQLKPSGAFAELTKLKLKDKEVHAIADVCPSLVGAESAQFLAEHLAVLAEPRGRALDYAKHCARRGDSKIVPTLLAFAQKQYKEDYLFQMQIIKALQQGLQEGGKPSHDAIKVWADQLCARLLDTKDATDTRLLAGLELANNHRLQTVLTRVLTLFLDKKQQPDVRGQAALVLVTLEPREMPATLGKVLVDAKESEAVRERAAKALASVNAPEAHAELLKAFANAPAKLQTNLALALASSPQGAEQLLQAVEKGKASARLLRDTVVDQRLKQTKLPKLPERLAKLTEGLPTANAQLQILLMQRAEGFGKSAPDAMLGAKVYEKNCAACHQLANKGGKVAPQLDGIGGRGAERLLEDILDPNRNVDQAFRATVLELKNGQIVLGLLAREEGAVYVMVDNQGKEQRYERKDVQSRTVAPQSPMPANFGTEIGEADLNHLLAFLLTQRPLPTKGN